MAEFIEVHTTIDSKEAAAKIAQALTDQHLAACVQISGPILSTYWWKGSIEQAEEWMCVVKTRADLLEAVQQAIKENHTYDVPEILAFDVIGGNNAYLQWIQEETKQGHSE